MYFRLVSSVDEVEGLAEIGHRFVFDCREQRAFRDVGEQVFSYYTF